MWHEAPPLPTGDPNTSPAASRIYRALCESAWEEALRLIEESAPRHDEAAAHAARAVLRAVPPEILARERWAHLTIAPTPPRPRPRTAADPRAERVVALTRRALERMRVGRFADALADAVRAQEAYDADIPRGRIDLGRGLVSALFAWASVAAGCADEARAGALLTRAYSAAIANGERRTAAGAAATLALLHASIGRGHPRDHWASIAEDLCRAERLPLPGALASARALASYDALRLDEARTRSAAVPSAGMDQALRRAGIDACDRRADPAAALAALDAEWTAEDRAEHTTPSRRGAVAVARARLLLRLGRAEQAREVCAAAQTDPELRFLVADIAAIRAAADLSRGDAAAALSHAQAASSHLRSARAVVMASAVEAAALLVARRAEAGEACARAVALADEEGLPSGLVVLSAEDLDAVLSYASAGSASARAIHEARESGILALVPASPVGGPAITAHELVALRLLAGGASMSRAAREMGVTVNTVKTHVRHLYAKLGVSNRAEMARAADAHGLL
ncbi:helix-turn-helix transcriptional regulator [Microbacterium excoecariae]|uniref:helix-turn-helix transcriptional regulator n=1 Tax=Microbacterium excoecariae TaxID=2715210 RepID=UPI00140DAF31|nr:helix-turn-helix transcriptional regulator [Microbacterium excoecariae]NHI16432.1 hypothetical protein [Microbacterium excoecariae]